MDLKRQLKLVDKEGNEISLDSFPFTLGSFKEYCSYWLDDKNVSPIHCQISQKGEDVFIRDLNSKLGVKVNDTIISEPIALQNGDIIKIGNLELEFSLLYELFTEKEFERLNANFKKILDNPIEQSKTAEKTIKLLLRKVLEVNKNAFGENTEYLETILEEIFSKELKSKAAGLSDRIEEDESIVENIKTVETQIPFTSQDSFEKESRLVDIDPNLIQNNTFSEQSFESTVAEDFDPLPEISSPMCILKETEQPFETICVSTSPFKIGRAYDSCHHILNRPGISRSHALIIKEDEGFILKDDNAVNGTFINDRQLHNEEAALHKGDLVRFYDYEFKVIEITARPML